MNIEFIFNFFEVELEFMDLDCLDSIGYWLISCLFGGLLLYIYVIDGINFEIVEGLFLCGLIVFGNYVLILRDVLGCEVQQFFEI